MHFAYTEQVVNYANIPILDRKLELSENLVELTN